MENRNTEYTKNYDTERYGSSINFGESFPRGYERIVDKFRFGLLKGAFIATAVNLGVLAITSSLSHVSPLDILRNDPEVIPVMVFTGIAASIGQGILSAIEE